MIPVFKSTTSLDFNFLLIIASICSLALVFMLRESSDSSSRDALADQLSWPSATNLHQ